MAYCGKRSLSRPWAPSGGRSHAGDHGIARLWGDERSSSTISGYNTLARFERAR